MPFKSQAQRRKLHALAKEGKISAETLKEFEKKTGNKKLPEKVKKK